jgi:hypothetical protein
MGKRGATLVATDRYVVLRRGQPVFTTQNVQTLVLWLWGRDIRNTYMVLDYEKAYPVDNPDLCVWMERLEDTCDV